MHQKLCLVIAVTVLNTSLWAMDINQTNTIINEAQKATVTLQNEFSTMFKEAPTPKQEEIQISIATPVASNIISVVEINETMIELPQQDINQSNRPIAQLSSIDLNESSVIGDINTSNCQEEIKPVQQYDANTSIDDVDLTNNPCSDIQGDSILGLIIFKTRIKPVCDISGEKFAKQYMQEDWDDIYHDHEFKMEVIKACPKIEPRYQDIWTPHLYQFALEYASDSDSIPEC